MNDPRLRIVALPGDGIGPEVMAAALRLLEAIGEFEIEEHLIGGVSIDAHGVALTDEVIAACNVDRGVQAVLLGAVGGPKWDTTDSTLPRPEEGLLRIRRELGQDGEGLYANLRPVRPQHALIEASPLKRELIEGTDLLVVRELTGGIYYGARGTRDGTTYDTCEYTPREIERIADIAFSQAKARAEEKRRPAKVTSVDKANVMDTSRLWRATVEDFQREHYPDIELEHLLRRDPH
jgi:3-isopropylmalate dehydrogenase